MCIPGETSRLLACVVLLRTRTFRRKLNGVQHFRRAIHVAIAATAAFVMLTSCVSESGAGSSSDASRTTEAGFVGQQSDPGDPVRRRTLAFGAYAPVASLDPLKTQMAGAIGGTQMAAIYDVLVKYNEEAMQFEPQLAKSVTVSDDQLHWTISLRDGTMFSDESPVDSNAVKWSIDRFVAGRGSGTDLWQDTDGAGVSLVNLADLDTVLPVETTKMTPAQRDSQRVDRRSAYQERLLG